MTVCKVGIDYLATHYAAGTRACEWPVDYSEVKYFKYVVYPTLPGKQVQIYMFIFNAVLFGTCYQNTVNPNDIANVTEHVQI